jgi:hypothetical protein
VGRVTSVQHVDEVAVHGDADRHHAARRNVRRERKRVVLHVERGNLIAAGVDTDETVAGADERTLRAESASGAEPAGRVTPGGSQRAVVRTREDEHGVSRRRVRERVHGAGSVFAAARRSRCPSEQDDERSQDHETRCGSHLFPLFAVKLQLPPKLRGEPCGEVKPPYSEVKPPGC